MSDLRRRATEAAPGLISAPPHAHTSVFVETTFRGRRSPPDSSFHPPWAALDTPTRPGQGRAGQAAQESQVHPPGHCLPSLPTRVLQRVTKFCLCDLPGGSVLSCSNSAQLPEGGENAGRLRRHSSDAPTCAAAWILDFVTETSLYVIVY